MQLVLSFYRNESSNVKHIILVHSTRSSCRVPPLHSHHCIIYIRQKMSAKRQRTDDDATSTGNVSGNNDRATIGKKPRLVEGWNSVTQYFMSILLPVVKLVFPWSHSNGEFWSLSVSFDLCTVHVVFYRTTIPTTYSHKTLSIQNTDSIMDHTHMSCTCDTTKLSKKRSSYTLPAVLQ